ncbi:MAG TPA: DGQHR domain-containing protein, partial [Candidatus Krumholzibacteria bacterium]|nr:DGQHR domain-containing protein [Candidatus Krumholzibacteria bacterium]
MSDEILKNISERSLLKGFARRQARSELWKTIKPEDFEEHEENGWALRRKNKRSLSIKKSKTRAVLLESRVWTLLYRMGFPLISGEGGATLHLSRRRGGATQQIDCVAVDEQIAIAVECKSYQARRRDPAFVEKLTKLSSIRGRFAAGVSHLSPADEEKRSIATIMFVWDLALRNSDLSRAQEEQVRIFDERDLEYYEALVKHLGLAARFQFLAEVFKGREIRGLNIRVPALRTRVGGVASYTFAIKPSYLLKIAYVAHRAKGKPFDVDAYQRMISKSRLKKIAAFISEGGVFPTNIVINIEDAKHVRFDQAAQLGDGSGGTVGWLSLAPAYGSAWIIDGQHRLFAYSGHERAETSFLNVLAFEGLSATRQTELFVEINSEQRRVKRSLLVELDATLKWNDEDEDKRIHAIVSKAGMALDSVQGSPLEGRVLLADVRRTKKRCVSL